MLSRWGRLMVAFAMAFAVWMIAIPARASAPLCDPRGATGIAPTPQLQLPETSIDVGAPQEDCSELLALKTAIDEGRAPAPSPPSAAQDPVEQRVTPALLDASVSGRVAGAGTAGSERAGARSRVDRPPRG